MEKGREEGAAAQWLASAADLERRMDKMQRKKSAARMRRVPEGKRTAVRVFYDKIESLFLHT